MITIIQDKNELEQEFRRRDVIAAVRSDCEMALHGQKRKPLPTDRPEINIEGLRKLAIQTIVCVIITGAFLLAAGYYKNQDVIKWCKNTITDSKQIHQAESYIYKLADGAIHKD